MLALYLLVTSSVMVVNCFRFGIGIAQSCLRPDGNDLWPCRNCRYVNGSVNILVVCNYICSIPKTSVGTMLPSDFSFKYLMIEGCSVWKTKIYFAKSKDMKFEYVLQNRTLGKTTVTSWNNVANISAFRVEYWIRGVHSVCSQIMRLTTQLV